MTCYHPTLQINENGVCCDCGAAPTKPKRATYRSGRCAVCRATVIVWKRGAVAATLLRALAMADHVRTMHGRAA